MKYSQIGFLITKGGRELRVPARTGPSGRLMAYYVCIVEIALDLYVSWAFDLLLGRRFDTIVHTPSQMHYGLARLRNERRAVENLASSRLSVSENSRKSVQARSGVW